VTRLSLLALVAVALVGCDTFPRAMTYATVPSHAMRGVWMEYAVYAPTDVGIDEHLPIVVFLHGGGDGPDCLDRNGIGPVLQGAMARGELPRAVVVVPEGDLGFWANWYDGSRHYEDWVIEELMPRVGHQFHTAACPEGCHLMGVSMGAEGALRIAIHRPGMFASVTAISGPSLDTDHRIAFINDPLNNIIIPTQHVFGPPRPRSRIEADDPFVVWRSPGALRGSRLMIAWGTHDRGMVREGSAALHAHLEQYGVPHTFEEFDGEHGWRWWSPLILEQLRTQLSPAAPAPH
jgi:enterochelin esterase-like enzyme